MNLKTVFSQTASSRSRKLKRLRGRLSGGEDTLACFERERLIQLNLQCLIKLSDSISEKNQFAMGRTYDDCYEKSPYEEAITELLLTLYIETEEKSKAVRHFNAYLKILKEELGDYPCVKLYNLYHSVK
jgi:DNA-binding SARP family transcriptional activator